MSVRKLGSVAAWSAAVMMAVLWTLLVLAAAAWAQLPDSPWAAAGTCLLLLSPWSTLVIAATMRVRAAGVEAVSSR